MRKFVLLAALVAAAGAASAQDAPKADKPARIAVVDMDRLTQESLLGKSYYAQLEDLNNQIDSEKKKKLNDIQKMETDIKALQDELEKQGALLSEDAAEKKRQEIIKKTREREAFYEDSRAELERMQQKMQTQAQGLNAEFAQKIQPLIEGFAKEKGIDIVLDRRGVMPINKAFDITNEVIVKIDDTERATKGAAAGKPAAPKTTAPAAPKPAATAAPKPSPAKP